MLVLFYAGVVTNGDSCVGSRVQTSEHEHHIYRDVVTPWSAQAGAGGGVKRQFIGCVQSPNGG